MKIGLDVYLWVTESLCTLCTDVEQPPRSAKWEKVRYKTVHSLFCTEGVGGEHPPTRVYKWLSGRLFCSGYTGLNSFHSTPALLRIGPFLESTSPLSKRGLQGLGLFRWLRQLMPQPAASRRPNHSSRISPLLRLLLSGNQFTEHRLTLSRGRDWINTSCSSLTGYRRSLKQCIY